MLLAMLILAAVPSGFSDSLVTSIGGPTALAFTPDGRMLITRQSGSLHVYENGALVATPAITFAAANICTNSERGLLGVAVDPAFASNGYVYLFRTVNVSDGASPSQHAHPSVPRAHHRQQRPSDRAGAGGSLRGHEFLSRDSAHGHGLRGVSATVTRNLDPRKVTLTFDTYPSGMSLRVSGTDLITPAGVTSWENWTIPISAFDQTFHGASYTFASWSDGGARTHDITTPATPRRYVANFTAGAGTDFFVVTPCRLIDTRGGAALTDNATRTFTLTGTCGIPITASALAVNITAITPTATGYLTFYPANAVRPATSTINMRTGRTRANNAILPLGANGDVTVYSSIGGGTMHIAIDVAGYFE